ncbi:hypothetical protein [Vibrio pacinii]|uniref:hypothetical protein n=1 Tax=Vibrio pacinii TaxID=170674 RepID=UPI000570BAF9|nr:hypothetical protein [Vibrio pacinii]
MMQAFPDILQKIPVLVIRLSAIKENRNYEDHFPSSILPKRIWLVIYMGKYPLMNDYGENAIY